MESKRGAFIVVVVVLIILFGTLWVYDSFISPKSQSVELGNEGAMLQKYVAETLNPGYIPEMLNVEHKRSTSGTLTGTDYTYSAGWSAAGADFNAFMHYSPDLTRIDDFEIMIAFTSLMDLDDAKARDLLTTYFKNVGEVRCEGLACERFSKGSRRNEGVGVISSSESGFTMLFSCTYFKGSEMFQWDTCLKR